MIRSIIAAIMFFIGLYGYYENRGTEDNVAVGASACLILLSLILAFVR